MNRQFNNSPISLGILGAGDPEMERIEALLRKAGVAVAYAAVEGKRCHPGNAYSADSVLLDGVVHTPVPGGTDFGSTVWVECEIEGLPRVLVADHHREGDPGYGKGPEEFLQASSLGQVAALVLGDLHVEWGYEVYPCQEHFEELGTSVSSCYNCHPAAEMTAYYYAGKELLPLDWVAAAAADHCLGAAYQGKCQSVSPEYLAWWRAETRSRFQGKQPWDLLRQVEVAAEALREAPSLELAPGVMVRDMRGPVTPELPEAAARWGIGYVAGPLVCPDGRQKITCSGGPEQVKAFMEAWAPEVGLTGVYGDPARGFAGGYLKRCTSCGDYPHPLDGVYGLRDSYSPGEAPVPGGLGGCGDAHVWA